MLLIIDVVFASHKNLDVKTCTKKEVERSILTLVLPNWVFLQRGKKEECTRVCVCVRACTPRLKYLWAASAMQRNHMGVVTNDPD